MSMARNWNTILRWIHLSFGMIISVYFGRITFTGDFLAIVSKKLNTPCLFFSPLTITLVEHDT